MIVDYFVLMILQMLGSVVQSKWTAGSIELKGWTPDSLEYHELR